jgi:protein-S-isoprenylcysteine O-methyltransferase Ste14
MLLNVLSYTHIIFYRGNLSATVQYLSYLASTYLGIKVSIPLTVMGFDIAIVPLVLHYVHWYLAAVKYRIPHEEALLKEHFDKEWDSYTSTRARLIPGIY